MERRNSDSAISQEINGHCTVEPHTGSWNNVTLCVTEDDHDLNSERTVQRVAGTFLYWFQQSCVGDWSFLSQQSQPNKLKSAICLWNLFF